MTFRRGSILFSIFLLAACGPRGATPEKGDPLESIEILTLKLQAREKEFQRFKQKLAAAPPHSRFREESDMDGVGERLTAARLQLDILRTSDDAGRAKATADFNAALADLTQFLHEAESRYQVESE